MDLNLDNYSLDELKNILQISEKDKTFPDMQKCLLNKVELIKGAEIDTLPESKENL